MRAAAPKIQREPRDRPAKACGDAIRAARKRERLTQEQLAERLQVAQSTVTDWERGYYFPDRRHWPKLGELLLLLDRVFLSPAEDPAAGVPGDGLSVVPREEHVRRETFSHLYNGLSRAAAEVGIFFNPEDFAYIVNNLWVRAMLLDDPPSVRERVDVLIAAERRRWERQRKT